MCGTRTTYGLDWCVLCCRAIWTNFVIDGSKSNPILPIRCMAVSPVLGRMGDVLITARVPYDGNEERATQLAGGVHELLALFQMDW